MEPKEIANRGSAKPARSDDDKKTQDKIEALRKFQAKLTQEGSKLIQNASKQAMLSEPKIVVSDELRDAVAGGRELRVSVEDSEPEVRKHQAVTVAKHGDRIRLRITDKKTKEVLFDKTVNNDKYSMNMPPPVMNYFKMYRSIDVSSGAGKNSVATSGLFEGTAVHIYEWSRKPEPATSYHIDASQSVFPGSEHPTDQFNVEINNPTADIWVKGPRAWDNSALKSSRVFCYTKTGLVRIEGGPGNELLAGSGREGSYARGGGGDDLILPPPESMGQLQVISSTEDAGGPGRSEFAAEREGSQLDGLEAIPLDEQE